MTKGPESWDGKVALVAGAGRGLGRAAALAIAARGAAVLVTGPAEGELGELVGEIAFGGGRARHLVGEVHAPPFAEASVARAVGVFGGLDLVVAHAEEMAAPLDGPAAAAHGALVDGLLSVYSTFHAAAPALRTGGRLLALLGPGDGLADAAWSPAAAHAPVRAAVRAGVSGLVRATDAELRRRAITSHAVLVGEHASGDARIDERSAGRLDPDALAVDLMLYLCSAAGAALGGQTFYVNARAARPT